MERHTEILRESLRSTNNEIREVREYHEAARCACIVLRQRDKMVAAGMSEHKIKKAMFHMMRDYGLRGTGSTNGLEAEHKRQLFRKRRMELKRLARCKSLAYGFLKGVPYKAMEQKCYEPPSWHVSKRRAREINQGVDRNGGVAFDAVFEFIKASTTEDPRVYVQRYAAWIGEAGKWAHPNEGHPNAH